MGWLLLAGFLAFQLDGFLKAPEPFVEKIISIEKLKNPDNRD